MNCRVCCNRHLIVRKKVRNWDIVEVISIEYKPKGDEFKCSIFSPVTPRSEISAIIDPQRKYFQRCICDFQTVKNSYIARIRCCRIKLLDFQWTLTIPYGIAVSVWNLCIDSLWEQIFKAQSANLLLWLCKVLPQRKAIRSHTFSFWIWPSFPFTCDLCWPLFFRLHEEVQQKFPFEGSREEPHW